MILEKSIFRATIESLFASGCPSAISRLVIPIDINAVDGRTSRSFSHVIKEVLELHPSLTERNTAPTVILKSAQRWIKTPITHVIPRSICSCALGTTVMAVFSRHFLHTFLLQAATALRVAATKMIAWYNRFFAAVTAAKPQSLSMIRNSCSAKNDEITENLPSEVR